jgi:hypothetical protein
MDYGCRDRRGSLSAMTICYQSDFEDASLFFAAFKACTWRSEAVIHMSQPRKTAI